MKIAFAIFVLTFAHLESSCTKSSPETLNVVVALSAPPSTLDPRFTTDATGSRIAGLLYSSLVRVGADLKPTADAATSWTINKTRYVFELRPHLTFSDGHELTPEDVDFSFATYTSARSAFASSFQSVRSYHSEKVNGHIRTTVELKDVTATFLADLFTLKLLEKEDVSIPPRGSGPFVLENHTANDIILKSRTDHPYASPHVPGIDFKIVRDDNTAS